VTPYGLAGPLVTAVVGFKNVSGDTANQVVNAIGTTIRGLTELGDGICPH
jgi:hypothetical protein